MRERRPAVLALVGLVVVLAGGCGDGAGQKVDVDRAHGEFGPVVDDVASALVSEVGATDARPAAGSLAPGEGDTCWYRSQTYDFPESLGVDTPLEELRDAVAVALEDHDGWGLLDPEEVPGGFVGVDAEGPGGARLELRTRAGTELRIVARVAGTCEREQLPLP